MFGVKTQRRRIFCNTWPSYDFKFSHPKMKLCWANGHTHSFIHCLQVSLCYTELSGCRREGVACKVSVFTLWPSTVCDQTVLHIWTTLSNWQQASVSCGPVRRRHGCWWCRSTLCSWQALGCPGVWGKTASKSHKVAYRQEDTHQTWQMASPRLHAWQGKRPEQSSKSSVFALQNKAMC